MKNLDGLVRLRFPNKFLRLMFSVVCNFSTNALHDKVGNGRKAIIYTSEFSSRETYTLFLKALVTLNPNEYTLYFFKRKFSLPNVIGNYQKIIRNTASKAYSQYLSQHRDLIFFAPHQIFSEALLGITEESPTEHNTVCLQHGYYNYSEHEMEIYSKSTRTDHAIVFNKDEKTRLFFQNVNFVHEIGYYFVDPAPEELPKISGISIFLTRVTGRELLEVLNFIFSKFGRSETYNISLHPHQELDENLVRSLIQDVNYVFNENRGQGTINIFYETTAFYSFENFGGKNYFMSRSHQLTEMEKIPFARAISKLNRTIDVILS